MRNKNTHWNKLEQEIIDIIGNNAIQTKGSGNQKGDLDVKVKIKDLLLMFEAKSEEIPSKNLIVKYEEFKKAKIQANTHYGIPIYVRKNKDNIPMVVLELEDFSNIINYLLNNKE